MGYTALLFCPDEKTVRTVTQVLSELEFTVEACIEPFAAVKKLMSTHFDAVVVDCDNEQNATLLFKSARNSTSNQTSLAVAVVEGQAGVAKAFRIGANLVLTKPINIEQAKGTLRVARGLLRKSEPGKPAAPAATMTAPAPPVPATPAPAAPVAAKPAAPKPAPTAKPAAPPAAKPAASTPVGGGPLPPRPVQTPVAKPAAPAAWPAAAAASSKPKAQDGGVTDIGAGTKSTPGPSAPKIAVPAKAEKPLPVPAAEIKPPVSAHASISSGAASAPAPALEPQETKIAEKSAEIGAASVAEKSAETSQPSAYVGAAPTFSFGASSEPQTSGGNKKIIIGVAAALVLAAAGYFGWTQFKGHGTPAPAAPEAAVTTPSKPTVQPTPAPVTPSTTAPTAPAPSSTTTNTASAPTAAPDTNTESEEAAAPPPAPKPAKTSSASSKPAAPAQPEPAPMMVKGGKVPAAHKEAPSADAPAPSMAGMAPGAAPPPDLVTTPTSAATPVLQTLSISQGVSQGLLYKKVSPIYPQNALRMRIEGSVELMATISKSGDITHIKTLSGDPQLTKAAIDAVQQWKYKPYLLNGEPVEIQTQITVNFRLPH
jgi:periplasmic protein TonB